MGTDAAGNIYISENALGPAYPLRGSNGRGTVWESYTPDGKRLWSLNGLEFVTMGGIDPSDENEFYDAFHRFRLDYSRPPGKEAAYVADTTDPIRYPRDIRLTKSNGAIGQIQWIHGRKFLFVTSQAGGFRFDPAAPNIAIPCAGLDYGAFQNKYNDWDYQPMNGEFIWRDLNGDGATQPDEFSQPANRVLVLDSVEADFPPLGLKSNN